jgi:hypothetical protein
MSQSPPCLQWRAVLSFLLLLLLIIITTDTDPILLSPKAMSPSPQCLTAMSQSPPCLQWRAARNFLLLLTITAIRLDNLDSRLDNPASRVDNPDSKEDNPDSMLDNPASRVDNLDSKEDNPDSMLDNPDSKEDNLDSRADNPGSREDRVASALLLLLLQGSRATLSITAMVLTLTLLLWDLTLGVLCPLPDLTPDSVVTLIIRRLMEAHSRRPAPLPASTPALSSTLCPLVEVSE